MRETGGAPAPGFAGLWMVAACLGLACVPAVAQTNASRSREAMAFIRVVGDLRVEYLDARKPVIREDVEVASGSGFVIAPSGLVLTSLHVVDMEVGSREGGPELTLEDGQIQVFVGQRGSQGAWEAHVVASDAENDLAALQLTALDLPYLPLGDATALEAGRPVQVLGFPFGRQTEVAKREDADVVPQVTVTAGSFSAAREDEAGETKYLQTDASMHPGSSGGPMLDEDGYVVGVVKMKLSSSGSGSGAGFTVSVNVVKDFLEANGLLDRLPVSRLRPGVRHTLDWKRMAIDLPDGYSDRSPFRVLADAGEMAEIGFRAERVATEWPVEALEEALLGGRVLPELVPAAATVRRQRSRARQESREAVLYGKASSRFGSAVWTDESGRAFRVEYAIVDLGEEKVVARHLGPADAVAFNLGLIRASLASLGAAPMLGKLPLGPLPGSADPVLELAPFSQGQGRVAVPSGWVQEPVSRAVCGEVPPAEAGLAVSHPADYTLVLRALRLREAPAALEAGLARCGARSALTGVSGPAYSFRVDRLGVPIAVREAVVAGEGGSLLLELEAPIAKLAIVDELYASWVGRLGAAGSPPH